MAEQGTWHRLTGNTVLDASGNGEVTVTARGRLLIRHTRVSVGPAPGSTPPRTILQPDVLTYLDDEEFESTGSGARDQSDSMFPMQPTSSLRAVWTGGDPGATATLIARGEWL